MYGRKVSVYFGSWPEEDEMLQNTGGQGLACALSRSRYQPPKNEVVEGLNQYIQAMYDTGCEPALSQP